jgi:hypothetical protein
VRDEFRRNYSAYVIPKKKKTSEPSKKVFYLIFPSLNSYHINFSAKLTVTTAQTMIRSRIRTPATTKKISWLSWTTTLSHHVLKVLQSLSSGGLIIKDLILDYHAWLRIFLQYQMSLSTELNEFILTWSLASSVAVERVFSKGRLIISHIRNRLTAQSTRALMCLGYWSKLGFVTLEDLKAGASLPDVKEGETWSEEEWNIIV